jgi:hypothetical protein
MTDSTPVVEPAVAPPALSGGNMAVMSDGRVVVGDSDRDTVWVFDAALTTNTGIALLPGDEPGRVIEGPAGHAFVALRRSGNVAELDLDQGKVIARFHACAAPRGLAWDDAAQTIYVACSEGVLVGLVDALGTLMSTNEVPVAPDLRDVVRVGGKLWVTTFRTAQVFEVTPGAGIRELAGPATTNVDLGDAGTMTFDPHVAWRAVPSGNGVLIAHQVASRAGAQLTSETLTPVNCNGVPVGAYGGIGMAQFGSTGMVHTVVTTVQYAPDGTSTTVDQVIPGIDEAVLPVDVAESGSEVAVLAAGNQAIFVTEHGNVFRLSVQGVPTAIAFIGGQLYAFVREPASLVRVTSAGFTPVVSPVASSVASTGFDLFHNATPVNIACASCHPEAGDDGNVWPLPEGRLRTPSLRGGISNTAPFHWAGEETTLSKLMFDIFDVRMAGPLETDDRVAALGRWLDAQPSRAAPRQDAAAVMRGLALFQSPQTACVTCHSGPVGTNNASVDVGTGAVLQVPRLVELAYRAPFLHDGRAQTLEDRFLPGVGGGDSHGHTSQLLPGEVSDLITYLRSR